MGEFKYGTKYERLDELKEEGCTNLSLAIYLQAEGLKYAPTTIGQYLTGYRPMPDKLRDALDKLADSLGEENGPEDEG